MSEKYGHIQNSRQDIVVAEKDGEARDSAHELDYSLGTAARLTGLSPDLLRAWERRYGVVEPLRTPGGTRRYRAADLERLRAVKAAVDAGHRVGRVANLDLEALYRLTSENAPASDEHLERILRAIERLDGPEAQRLISLQLSALGPVRFARELAGPLLREIGDRWARDRLDIAAEHLASGVLRAMLGSALQPSVASMLGPKILFATIPGERHELGLQMAAVTALGAGGNPVYLGAELPIEELLAAVDLSGAAALALSCVSMPVAEVNRSITAIRAGMSRDVRLWVGGAVAAEVEPAAAVECLTSLQDLEHQVALLAIDRHGRGARA